MEVSKETWVCSTDFLRWRPPHYGQQPGGGGQPSKEGAVGKPKPKPKTKPTAKPKPKRISGGHDHLKGVAATALAVEQKLKLAVPAPPPMAPFGPFVLTRCKSEPMRSSARLAPDACFWKERHRPIGAAGIGF
uniref:Uncharacterized protein n=1 Tax=Ananas comosus var. bracteatus TaxID=296719 RepID=A0A6V7QHI0_ANACO|nr:unnamed protein product [Ananas comosus var. bracteatus]